MADVYVENVSWGSRIVKSIKGVVVGLALFFGSFVLLWFNEGRIDMSEVAKKESVPIDSGKVDPSSEGKFVSITGAIRSDEKVGDPDFLKEGSYIKVVRSVEMFSWDEETETKDNKKTYRYETKWTISPDSSSSFHVEEGHENPEMPYQRAEFHVNNAKVGAYPVDMSSIQLSDGIGLKLTSDLMSSSTGRLEGEYLYIGKGTLSSPVVGDVRIQFSALGNGTNVTAFGTVHQGSLAPFVYKSKDTLYRALEGTRDEAILHMHREYQMIAWGLRIGGFLMMWIGLTLLFGPITTFLDVIPVLGKASGCVIHLFMFVVAFFLSVFTMLVSMVVHNLFLLMAITLLCLVGIGVLLVRARQKSVAAAQAP